MAKIQDSATGTMVEVEVGQLVGFKQDYEKGGRVVEIRGDDLVIRFRDDVTDELVFVQERAVDCWKES